MNKIINGLLSFAMVTMAAMGVVSCRNSKPATGEADCYGIDLSHHNTVTDWDKVTAKFVYLKATEGATHRDSKFDSFVTNAKKRGILVGAYHFYVTTSTIESQFQNFCDVVDKYKIDLIPVLDLERGSPKTSAEVRADVRTFVNLCKKHFGVAPILYCSQPYYMKNLRGDFSDCMYWCGDVDAPAVLPHVLHQKCIKAVPGVKGRVDYNVLDGELSDICLP